MSVNAADSYAGEPHPLYEDEIDLRHYFGVLLHWWREIALVTILLPLLVLGALLWLRSTATPSYTARADVVIARLTSSIELDDRVSTSTGPAPTDAGTWRNSLLTHAKADDIARTVVTQLGDALPEDLRTPARLQKSISAEVAELDGERAPSNIIRIGASTTDPELSVLVADTWAVAFIDYVNNLYGEVPVATLRTVEDERLRTRAEYEAAQAEYEAFLANNHVDALQRQINSKENLRSTLVSESVQIANTVVLSDTSHRLEIYQELARIPSDSQTDAIQLQRSSNYFRFSQMLEERQGVEQFLMRARTMEDSLLAGNEATAATNALALQLLKVDIFTTSDFRYAVETWPVTTSLEAQLADVQGLIAALEATQRELNGLIAEGLQSQIGTPELGVLDGLVRLDEAGQPVLIQPSTAAYTSSLQAAYAALVAPSPLLLELPLIVQGGLDADLETIVAQLETDIRRLRAELAAEQSRERDITRARELAWSAYDAMLTKGQELNILRASSTSEVRLGSRALPPTSPDPQLGLLLPIAAAGVAAFMFAVVMALLINAMGGKAWFARSRRPKLQSA